MKTQIRYSFWVVGDLGRVGRNGEQLTEEKLLATISFEGDENDSEAYKALIQKIVADNRMPYKYVVV
jgi:hypothetical protein